MAPAAESKFLFEPNRGQTDSTVKYLARGPQGAVFYTANSMVFQGVRIEFAGADPEGAWEGSDPVTDTISYYTGRDAAKWVRDLPRYRRLLRRHLYPGIDAAWYGSEGRLEYDFLLAPHADPSRIRLRIPDATRVTLEADGTLAVATGAGELRQRKPRLFQGGREVSGSFRLLGRNEIGFSVTGYNPKLPLSIDPVLESSTYVGGGGEDRIVGTSGTGSYAGMTSSIDFPSATFARRRGMDVIVSTPGPYGGNSVVVIGGSGDEQVTGVSFGYRSATVVGYTDSRDLPTNLSTSEPYQGAPVWQPNFAGGATDGFVLWVGSQNSSSSRYAPPLFLSYFGTPGDDRITAISNSYFGTNVMVGWTTGSGFPVASKLLTGQTNPAGGVDGFVVQVNFSLNSVIINAMTYLGGSGDDKPLGVFIGLVGSFFSYYVTGETTSGDFPLVNAISSQRSGPSDAFVVRLLRDNSGFRVASSTLLGGSGTDRGVAAIITNPGNILIAGVTSSSDLPVVNPLQAAYGGGPSDAFLAELSPDLSKVVGLTWFGGSGADEATAIAADNFGNVYIAGWTSSQDLPVQNAVQSQYGGGPDDGFLLHLQSDRTIYAATYYGGSGSDRVYGLTVGNDLSAWLAGQTTSRDLPLQKASQSALLGGSDGFLAQISAPLFGVYRLIGSKGFRGTTSLNLGMQNGDTSSSVTVTSSDPASVLVAPDRTSIAQAQATLSPTGYYVSSSRLFFIDCLVSRGGADLTFSAPGYVTQTVHADCYPAQVRVTYTRNNSAGLFDGKSPVFSLWGGPITLDASLLAVNPDIPGDIGYLASTPGSGGAVVQVNSSNPAVGTLGATTLDLDQPNSRSVEIQPLALGDTLITFSSPKLDVPAIQPITVASPLAAPTADIWTAGGFQTQLPGVVRVGRGAPAFTLTVTSQDPSRLVVSTDASQPGSASASLAATGGLFLQALDTSGDVPLTLSVDGFNPVTTTVHLSTPLIGCSGCVTQASLGVQEQLYLSPLIRAAGAPINYYSLSPNPGAAPVRLSLQSSDSSVLNLSDPVDIKPGVFQFGRLFFAGAVAGNATVTLKATAGLPIDPVTAGPAAITVVNKPLRLADLDLGKDLAAFMTVLLPIRATVSVPITVTVGDPNLALLATSPLAAGQRQLSFTTSQGSSFYVLGLSDAGQTTITASAPGWGTVTATVTLGPSGFGWNAPSYTTTLYSTSYIGQYMYAFVLDRATMLPIGTQSVRAGVTAPVVKLTNSNPAVATATDNISMGTCNNNCTVAITAKSVGNAALGIVQPPGFSTPSIRQTLAITVLAPSVTANSFSLGKDLQSAIQYNVPGNVSQPLTITSSDPSKVVFSTDPTVPGSASVTFLTDARQTVWAQALDNNGTVNYTVSTAGFNDATAKVQLLAVGAGLTLPQSGYTTTYSLQNGVATTTVQSQVTPLTLSIFTFDATGAQQYSGGYSVTFRPGVNPPQVEVRTSDANVGAILRGPAVLSAQNTATVDFKPLAPGDTDVTVVQPPGWIAPPAASKISFHVTQPGFGSTNLVMGKDTYLEVAAALLGYVAGPQTNVPVTITSSDPSRVLVSSSADSPTGSSVIKTLIAGKNTTDAFSIHALDNRGLVSLKVSAPGYADGIITVALSDTYFSFGNYPSSPVRAVIQNGPQSVGIVFQASTANLPAGYSYQNYTLGIRPGVTIALNVRTSDAGVVAVDNPQVILIAGRTNVTAIYRPVSPGSASLTLEVPSEYLPGANASIAINVEAAKLTVGYGTPTVGRDLQTAAVVSAESPFKQNTSIVLTSSDPSRLLLSTSATVPGQASLAILAAPNIGAQFWLQSLGDSGTVTVSASADGYQLASLVVNLVPVAAVFTNSTATSTLYTNSNLPTFSVAIGPLNSNLTFAGGNQPPRPGVDFTVGIHSSDNSVIAPSVTSLHFTDGNAQSFQVRPVGVGTAILSVDKLPNGVAPSTGSQIVFTVAEPDLFLPNFTLGRDLQAPVQVKLASRLPAPATDVILTVSTDYTFLATLSNDPAVAGSSANQSISVILPAGQHLSRPFYVQGAGTNNASGLSVTGGSYTRSSAAVTLASATAFVFREAAQTQPINVGIGSPATFTVIPAVLPLGTALPPGVTIRAGAAPITVAITSSSAAVLQLTSATAIFKPGDSQVTVTARGVAAGRARLTLSGPSAYDFANAQAALDVQVK